LNEEKENVLDSEKENRTGSLVEIEDSSKSSL
jgi:hypothetical protein